jgi:hypothetical protein
MPTETRTKRLENAIESPPKTSKGRPRGFDGLVVTPIPVDPISPHTQPERTPRVILGKELKNPFPGAIRVCDEMFAVFAIGVFKKSQN